MNKRFLGTLRSNEEVVVEKGGYVYAKEIFDKRKWAKDILLKWEISSIDYYIGTKANTIIAFYYKGTLKGHKPGVAICHPDDKFDITIGKAIALCRLKGIKIPKEIFE